MDRNTELVENMANYPMSGNFQQPVESLTTTHGQRVYTPEVSNLISSVDRLTSHNFELLKMAREPGNNIGLYQKARLFVQFNLFQQFLIFLKKLNQHWNRYPCR